MANVYTTHEMNEQAAENGVYVIPITAFYDEDGSAVTPSAITWTLMTTSGTVVNSRENVSASGAAVDIVLSGDDLDVTTALGTRRVVYVTYTYNSDNGTGLVGRMEIKFRIVPLLGV